MSDARVCHPLRAQTSNMILSTVDLEIIVISRSYRTLGIKREGTHNNSTLWHFQLPIFTSCSRLSMNDAWSALTLSTSRAVVLTVAAADKGADFFLFCSYHISLATESMASSALNFN